ncbi:adenosylcobinamide-GDP ribazoletransferase [Parahaliea mediterranea]|uniref:Adenosylcobinamide-GDP ribazoletransferase n=1 Tax=Parahaliea mediterranea TaxID=651086 RepID=A0A939DEW6_9GAMM|nr:adenosylcobinamide-GDP ribazoletransferase [Parahaliea mediterranea]MBN7796227.1 adenosylcobinamide-GDP ribazoletransferase [Parahaliea mediterranea]
MSTAPPPGSASTDHSEWQALACAITFLTRIPVPLATHSDALLARSVMYFPVVGLLVGAIGAAAYYLATALWPPLIAVLLALSAMLLATGGFHEDGLADTADGLGGGWRVKDKLRIMKDSRLGSYGALALVMALLLKVATLSALAGVSANAVPVALVLGQVLGRWAALPLIRLTPYVGGEAGSGRPLVPGVANGRLAAASAFALACVLCLQGQALTALLVTLAAVIALWRRHCLRQLGGLTGDTLGAGNQLAELAVYLVLLALAT